MIWPRFFRSLLYWVPALVLSTWATVMLQLLLSGKITHLLSPTFRFYVWIATILLYAFSLLHLWLYQPGTQATPLPWLSQIRQMLGWLVLLVPVLAATLFSPDALSQTTFLNRAMTTSSLAMPTYSTTSQENLSVAAQVDPNQPAPMELTDLKVVAANPSETSTFEGKKIKIVGLYTNLPNSVKLVRWMIWCCAADAQPISVDLTGANSYAEAPKDPAQPAWVEVIGTLHFQKKEGKTQPLLEAASIQTTMEPDEPYLSP